MDMSSSPMFIMAPLDELGKASPFAVADIVGHFLWIEFKYFGDQRLSENQEKGFKEKEKTINFVLSSFSHNNF